MKLGAIQSSGDHRDFVYGNFVATVDVPTSLFFYPRIPVNEQIIGDCVGQSARAIKYIQEQKNHPGRNIDFAPDYIYVECKKRDGIPTTEGTYPKTAMSVLKYLGTARKGQFPDLKIHTERPTASQEVVTEAAKFKVGAYAKIQTIAEFKHAIVNQGPVMVGVTVTDSFVEAPGGLIGLPNGSFLGGHAIALDGFDDNKTATVGKRTFKGFFRFVNSWGTDWGDNGYGWLPYEFVTFRSDIGMSFFNEAWSSLDIIMPNESAKSVVMWLNSTRAIVDGQEITLDQSPINKDGRTLLPVRFLAEVVGYKVDWDEIEKKITLKK